MLFYNEDWIHFIWTRYVCGIEITKEVLKEYVYSFKDSQVTDFVMNVNGTVSTAPSEVFETFADKYLVQEENGVTVNYKNTFAQNAYKLICEKQIDMYEVWIGACHEIGINPWISIRVNDCHGNTEETDLRKSSFVEANPQLHIASYREKKGYFDRCLDYSQEKVRARMLKYIDEMLGHYDVYGLELDMMRDFIFTKPGYEAEIKKFLDGVCEIRRKYEEKYKHEIKLSMLLPSSINLCLERGVNPCDYAEEIDFIVIISRWQTTDTDMPIELWKQYLRGTKIKLGGGQQLYTRPYLEHKPFISSVKMAFGEATANLSRGCDFVYLYNYMDMREPGVREDVYEESVRNDVNRPLIFNNIGSIQTLLKQARSHVVTYSDFPDYSLKVSSRLPIEFTERSGYQLVKIPVGKIPQNAELSLILGVHAEASVDFSNIEVYTNSAKCEFIKTVKLNDFIYKNDCYVFKITKNIADIIYAEIKISQKCRLDYVEIEVIPQ